MKRISGYEEFYAATEDGRIISIRSGKELKPYENTGGYLRVNLYDATGKATHKYVHRLIADAFLPNPDGLPEVDHKNANRQDNRASNLRWCNRQGNTESALAMGHWSRQVRVEVTNLRTAEIRRYAFLRHASKDLFGNNYSLNYSRKQHGDSFEKDDWHFEVIKDGV